MELILIPFSTSLISFIHCSLFTWYREALCAVITSAYESNIYSFPITRGYFVQRTKWNTMLLIACNSNDAIEWKMFSGEINLAEENFYSMPLCVHNDKSKPGTNFGPDNSIARFIIKLRTILSMFDNRICYQSTSLHV